ncbi:MarR family transcriptional regulator, partial [Escherichia coli]|nr:MarR family transcriptional regulator [Escherichia coli]
MYDLHYKFYYNEVNALKGVIIMSTNKNDYEH